MNRPARLIVAATTALLMTTTIGRAAEVPVEAAVAAGTRTLSVKSLGGSSLSSLALGTAGSSGFMVSVTDLAYRRSSYQVSASLSDLYAVSGASYDCQRKIGASNLSLDFLTSPTSLSGVAAIAAPVWNLTGSLTGLLATTLGVADGTPISASNVSGEPVEKTLSGAFSGVEGTLPVGVSSGTSGAFTAPASHAACAPAPSGSPTTRLVTSGSEQNPNAMFAWVQSAITDTADQNLNGTITGAELLATGSIGSPELAEATRSGLGTAGVNLALLDTLVNAGTVSMSDIYALLTATLAPLTSLIGQSGQYASLPKLNISIPTGTASGTYRGTLTVTLVDL